MDTGNSVLPLHYTCKVCFTLFINIVKMLILIFKINFNFVNTYTFNVELRREVLFDSEEFLMAHLGF